MKARFDDQIGSQEGNTRSASQSIRCGLVPFQKLVRPLTMIVRTNAFAVMMMTTVMYGNSTKFYNIQLALPACFIMLL